MPEPFTILIIIGAVLGLGILWKFLGVIWKIISIALTILFIISLIVGYISYQDAQDFKERFEGTTKIIIIEDAEGIITAVETTLEDVNISFIKVQKPYDQYDYPLIIILDTELFNDVETIDFNDISIQREQAFLLLRNDQLLEQQTKYINATTEEKRAFILTSLLNAKLQREPLFIVNGIKDKTIEVIPAPKSFQLFSTLGIDKIIN